jgi:hypothetical protein
MHDEGADDRETGAGHGPIDRRSDVAFGHFVGNSVQASCQI